MQKQNHLLVDEPLILSNRRHACSTQRPTTPCATYHLLEKLKLRKLSQVRKPLKGRYVMTHQRDNHHSVSLLA